MRRSVLQPDLPDKFQWVVAKSRSRSGNDYTPPPKLEPPVCTNPYTVQCQRRITWLLCWKHALQRWINKDMATAIARMVPLDMQGWCQWDYPKPMHLQVWFRGPYEWIWGVHGERYGRPPCLVCLRPCLVRHPFYKSSTWMCKLHGEQYGPKHCKTCGIFGICLQCFEDTQTRLGALVEQRTISDERFHMWDDMTYDDMAE